jgi:Flp pilus assembly protein TadG
VRLRALQTVGQACGGTAAIEFALVAPAFLGLLFGTVEFGRLLWTEQALQETAIAGARCMAILQSACTAGGRYYSSANTTTYVQQVAS